MKTTSLRWKALALVALALSGTGASAWTLSPDCGALYGTGSYGPVDFRTNPGDITVVLTHHFTNDVEKLIQGRSGSLGSDISYTLVAMPNFHRGLAAMMRLADRDKTDQPSGARFTLSCYFERAIEYRPDDLIVRMLYAEFLTKRNRSPEAILQLDYVASQAQKDNPLTQYNLGLLYLGAGEYDKAAARAQIAESLGRPVDDIRERLAAVGHPMAATPGAPTPASAPAAAASAASR